MLVMNELTTNQQQMSKIFNPDLYLIVLNLIRIKIPSRVEGTFSHDLRTKFEVICLWT